MTSERPHPAVHPHVILKIIRPVELLVAHRAAEGFDVLVLFDVTLTVVLTYEPCPAIVASVRLDVLVGVHVRGVVSLSDESRVALVALERFGHTGCVGPFVELQVPSRAEFFVADKAGERFGTCVGTHVEVQR